MKTTKLQPALQPDADELAMLESEREYFRAGAHNRPVCGGTLSVIPGLQHLPAGCVLHDITAAPGPADTISWVRSMERRFLRVGSRLCRFYLPGRPDQIGPILQGIGYARQVETGLTRDLEAGATDIMAHLNLRPLDPARGWTQKIQLCIQAGLGPDGYDMRQGAYATLERTKCQSGYMRSYLYWRGSRAVGAASLAVHGGFARLKNVLVHPEYRARGVGRAMVIGMMDEARRQGATVFGVFARTEAARQLYARCGMAEQLIQTEWTRAL